MRTLWHISLIGLVFLMGQSAWAQDSRVNYDKNDDLTIDEVRDVPMSVLYEKDFFKPYDRRLRAFDDESLWELSRNPNQEAYRLIWMPDSRSPDIKPLLFLIELDEDENASFTTKRTNGSKEGEVGKLSQNETKLLAPLMLELFYEEFYRVNFWNLENLTPCASEPCEPIEGAEWIFEAVEGGKYHSVYRVAPISGNLLRYAEFMLGITGIDVEEMS